MSVEKTAEAPLLDLKRLDEDFKTRLRAAFERILSSGHYILGPEVSAFLREKLPLLDGWTAAIFRRPKARRMKRRH